MKKLALILAFAAAASVVEAQNLTPAQKDADFRSLASLFSTYYAPVDWKKQLFDFDVLSIKPWLDKVAATKTDLDFYEVCVDYVASLRDSHDRFYLPSDFSATLGFSADIYDGALLIDYMSSAIAKTYPFAIGDELVSVDGTDVQQLVSDYTKYAVYANPSAAKRMAAARITSRPQMYMPHATDVLNKSAKVVIKRQNGSLETYTIPWVSTGTPLQVGPVPSPKLRPMSQDQPDYMAALTGAAWSGMLDTEHEGLNGYGSRTPIFYAALPDAGFTQRLGKPTSTSDFFYSGTFKYDELTIGYIRIPSYSPSSTTAALAQFQQEIAYMNANTDGLIVDEMRNPGGNLCYGEEIAARLIPYQFRATGFQLRPYWSRINSFYNSMISAKAGNAPQQVIQQYETVYNAMLDANRQGKTITDTLPLCTSSLTRPPLLDNNGKPIAYSKVLMILVDEFSMSTADSVPAMIKDAGRAVLFGTTTNGAGGNNTTFDAGSYSEGMTGMTLALQVRPNYVNVRGFPYTNYIENVGVTADIPGDYMTKDNLLQGGAPFVSSFLQHMAQEIRARR